MKTKFEMKFKEENLSSELLSYLVTNPEASAYSFVGHKGWIKEIEDYFGYDCDEYLKRDDVVEGKKYILVVCESGYMLTIGVEELLDSLLNDIGVLESI